MTVRKPKSTRVVALYATEAGSASLGTEAYRRLQDAIARGELKSGARLLESELAAWLGTSRTPIREALSRLESDGLVVRDRHRGMIVVELDEQSVSELYVMREVLEGTAAALAVRHASDEHVATLRQIAARDRTFGDDAQRLASNHRIFHETLYRCAHNRFLLRTLNSLRESMSLLGQTTLSLPGRSKTALDEHEAIVPACC
jgi:DNA-binding GntR family transcriptional regulator